MTARHTARFGEWASPVSAEQAVGSARGIGDVEIEGGVLWLTELRPDQGGQAQIVRLAPDGSAEDMLPQGFSARSRVHEYGGGAILAADGAVYFVNDRDQQVWHAATGAAPEAVTNASGLRFADMVADSRRQRLIAVCEDHREAGEPRNSLVGISRNDGAVEPVWAESDFVAFPRVSPDGATLAWVSWQHPNMPWDATSLHVATLGDDGALRDVRTIVSAADGFSTIQPVWAADGTLYFLSDRPGDWSLYRWRDDAVALVAHADGEIGSPMWNFRGRDFAIVSPTRAIAALTKHASDTLVSIDLTSGAVTPVETPFTAIRAVLADGEGAVLVGASPEAGPTLYRVSATGQLTRAYRPQGKGIAPIFASTPRAIAYPSTDGATAHAFYYPPHHPEHAAPSDDRPPLIVTAHGGPSAAASPMLTSWRTYWTSRGFAVLDVNYRGSTGFGTAYRRALNGKWGEVDIADVVAGARYCAEHGLADAKRTAVYGGSAGGYVVLAALAFYPDVFAAGVNLYGISDLEALAHDTHKFEAHYTDTLIGPLPAAKDIYRARSPLYAADQIRAPLLTLQGLDDKAVPPSQSEMIYEAVKAKGVPTAYVPFAGEGHGFRKAENQLRTLTATHYFLAKVFGLTPADELVPVGIDNLRS